MKPLLRVPLLLVALAGFGLLSCDKSEDAEPEATGTGLAGTWQLTKLECNCAPGIPNETATFTDSTFSIFTNGRVMSRGTYANASSTKTCGITSSTTSGLRFTEKLMPPFFQHDAQVSLQGNTLVLDYGLPCDAPRKTYRRIQ